MGYRTILVRRKIPFNRLKCVSYSILIGISKIPNKYLFYFWFIFFGLKWDNGKLGGVIRNANINVTTCYPMRKLVEEDIIS